MATGAMDKLDQLDKVEKEIVSCLYTAGQGLAEIAKVNLFVMISYMKLHILKDFAYFFGLILKLIS